MVSQSQAAYDNTERDLMLLDAYINDPAKQAKTADVLGGMTDELKPFADVTYTWFDAALIPFREGLEALLIIATLLTYTKKNENTHGEKMDYRRNGSWFGSKFGAWHGRGVLVIGACLWR